MKLLLAFLSTATICFTGEAASVSDSIKTIRSVGPEGQGNTAAAKAWKSLAQANAAALPEILRAIRDSSPLSANWLRAAVDTIADRGGKLPQQALLDFIADQKQEPRARRLAFELIQKSNPKLADKLIPGLINDPSVELRRDAVARVLEAGTAKQTSKQTQAAVKDFRKALDAARDIDQIQAATTALRQLNQKVDLPRHFGFLMYWNVIGPFDNTERKGFATVFPPEKKIDLSATYEGKAGKVKWTEFITADEYGMVDINKAYPGPGDGLKEVTAFAYTEYTAASTRPAQLRLGCKNGWKIWHNGQLVFSRDEYHRGIRIDQYQLDINLTKGRNTFLVKLCQNEQQQSWTKQWQFQLRVCDATGTAVLAADRPPTPETGTDNSGNNPTPGRRPRN
tara:strand:- start:467 stop:1651 length:1185 start_codon:yes stop_codon:yes gene_type:complete